ncbi:acidic mammalian chitinase-like isoform X1 [Leguminivora glycinivorella]|uniref:acidic mammalian chitinase-like isoform X1 n=1 Tax=Leguminivora glycinivorella TaxID=1035111 RepID=UPI00200BC487|nr:acidic mammalian chitinase-like isoform X1 [Leguminivora glycinivorella]
MKLLLVCALLCVGGSFAASVKASCKSSGVVTCYYGTWANGRSGKGRFGVSDLPTHLCTHIVYSFLTLDGTSGGIVAPKESTVEGKGNSVSDLIALKKKNPELKILAAIGGWNEASTNFSAVVNDKTKRALFVKNLYNYVDTNGFDGLDLDWEYPSQREGVASDKKKFVTLVKELKKAFAKKSYLLTAACAVTQSNIDLSYDVPALSKHLDYIHLMLYDFHGSWETTTGVNAPLYAQETDAATLNLNVKNSVHTWINNGASPSKLVLGLGAYGKTFTLTSLDNTSTGAPVTGAGVGGPYVGESGTYSYLEICEDQKDNPSAWSITEVEGNYVYANKDLFWVGYDNPNTIKAKAQYAKNTGLAGIMYWAIDLDDFSGTCGDKFPLVSAGIAGYNSA